MHKTKDSFTLLSKRFERLLYAYDKNKLLGKGDRVKKNIA